MKFVSRDKQEIKEISTFQLSPNSLLSCVFGGELITADKLVFIVASEL